MFKHIIEINCLLCGSATSWQTMICGDCIDKLPIVEERCDNCGHALAVTAPYCRYCTIGDKFIDRYYFDYAYGGAMKKIFKDIKFSWRFRGVNQLKALIKGDNIEFGLYDMVVPIPNHFYRNFERFKHPVNVISARIGELSGLPVTYAVKRVRATAHQLRLKGKERQKNIKGAFKLDINIKGMNILIVDDIITTGATVGEVAKVLKKGGAKGVSVYTIASGIPKQRI